MCRAFQDARHNLLYTTSIPFPRRGCMTEPTKTFILDDLPTDTDTLDFQTS
jgi:hypothetical protein